MDSVEKKLLDIVDMGETAQSGAVHIRKNGKEEINKNSDDVKIEARKDNLDGLNIYVRAGAVNAEAHVPVLLTIPGLIDRVYNDYYIGENATVTIVSGCGLHNNGTNRAQHEGIHRLHVGKNAKVKYIEKHFGDGEGKGERVINPSMEIEMEENSSLDIDTSQIKGIDSSVKHTKATLADGASLVISEKLMTHGKQFLETNFEVLLNGVDSTARITSRSFVTDSSSQRFISHITGNNKCRGRVECDAMLKDSGTVTSIPEITANHVDAALIHEATVGKIAGDQLQKLMSLGLDEKAAEEEIIKGFLR